MLSRSTGSRSGVVPVSGAAKIVAALLLVALLLLLTVLQISASDEIRPNVSVLGVDVGGMTPEEARAALLAVEDERSSQDLTLTDGRQTWTVTTRELGLVIDIDGALDEAYAQGRDGLNPSRVAAFWHLRRSTVDVTNGYVAVATNRTESLLGSIAADVNQPMIEPDLTVSGDGSIAYREGQIGYELQIDESIDRIVDALSEGATEVQLVVETIEPQWADDDFAEARASAERVLDAPLTIEAAGETWTFQPSDIAGQLWIDPPTESGPARLQVDAGWIERLAVDFARSVDREPRAARVWWNEHGQLYVQREPEQGRELDRAGTVQLVHEAFTGKSAADLVSLPVMTDAAPALPQDLGSLGLTSVISEASTPYGESIPERAHNIEYAAQLLNGTLVMPGQLFSFNSEIGPMTVEAGFQVAFGIASVEGRLETIPTEAGGICQVATTLFQPVFTTGYQIEQRSTHSYWIGSYTYNGMVGLDATVDPAAGLDLKWINDSDQAVLIQAEADGENFTVRLIGQRPNWDVEIQEPEVMNVDPADHDAVEYRPDTSLEVGKTLRIEKAQDGFDVRIVRIVRTPEGEERVWDFTQTYEKARNVVLVGSENGELPAGFESQSG